MGLEEEVGMKPSTGWKRHRGSGIRAIGPDGLVAASLVRLFSRVCGRDLESRRMPYKYLPVESDTLRALHAAGVCLSLCQSSVICYTDRQGANIW